ncbi:uncharacterized protein SAPINGB_P003633 [Magnusiomyces paraingens]|uniref:SGNH hydrolase-type esterase domain-containing protein n=1 Tax=Magnusiomyces paraingens TaxID=2606893 RepID=A0A5E8BXT4_9ASCO|nr:uncharacterized protein SAPINGB_P003633 [Saprochaete ingens]VVT53555.1 unnamed protein product [Saprochaete ingens]
MLAYPRPRQTHQPEFVGLIPLLLAAILAVFSVGAGAAETKDNKPIPPLGKEYIIEDSLFITPKSHPGLFSFNGRWLRYRDTFYASSWPATSVNVLIYGDECSIKLRPPRNTGVIKNQRFLVSVDGSPQLVLSLPPYNAEENPVFDVRIDLPPTDPSIKEEAENSAKLVPHVVEIMSDEENPLHILGISMTNTVVRQGSSWVANQRRIPHIEFVADKSSNFYPSVNQTSLYAASRSLGLRQTYIHKYDTCFSSHCYKARGGLAQQYEWLSPFDGNPKPADARNEMPFFHVFNRIQRLFETTEPQFVVVDVGDNDLLKGVSPHNFYTDLQMFLGQLIVNHRPDAQIFVIIRDGRYFHETEDAVISMRNSNVHAVYFGQESADWWRAFFCSYILPLADQNYPYAEFCSAPGLTQITGSSATSGFFSFLIILGLVASVSYAIYVNRGYILSLIQGSSNLPHYTTSSSKPLMSETA